MVRKTTSIISGKNEKEKFFAKFPHSPRPLSDFWGRRVRNRPEQSLTLSALAIPGLRAGQVIFADLPGIDVRRTFLVEEVTQDIVEETMSLKVKVV